MKRLISAFLLATAAFSASATAVTTPQPGECSIFDIQGAIACRGGLAGNDLGTAANVANVGNQFLQMGIEDLFFTEDDLPFTLIDSSDNTRGSQIAFVFETGGKTGEILLKDPNSVLPTNYFGISLKAGNFYSIYLFDGSLLDLDGVLGNVNAELGWTSLTFTTEGTGQNWKGVPLGLSHASLWGLRSSDNFGDGCLINPNDPECVGVVSEPGTIGLMAAGLIGMVAATRRRKSKAV